MDSPRTVDVMLLHLPVDAEARASLEREVAAVTGLVVPGLATVLGCGEQDGQPTVVSEHVVGRPLGDLLADGPLGASALDILRPVGLVVDTLHDRGILHRDLTPDAVVVGPDGRAQLRFTTFGHPVSDPTATAAGVSGSMYRAPEQAGGTVVSHRTDLYAFACVAFEAITGTPPFTLATLVDQAVGAVPRATARHPALPGAVDDVFRRALAVTSTDRPPSATAFVDMLESAFGPDYRPRAAAGRRRARGAVAVLTVAAVAAVVWGLLLAPRGDLPPAADPDVRYALTGSPIEVGANPADVEAGAGFVWASGADDGSITRIDPATGATTTIDVGGEPGQIVVADGAVWVRNLGDRITRVDVATGTVSAPIPGGGGPVSGMAVGGGYVWLTHRLDSTVTRVDPRTLAVVGDPIGVGAEPRAIEFGTDAAYVLNTADGTMSRIDATSAEVTGTVPVGQSLGGMEVDAGVVYVAADGDVVPVLEQDLTVGERYTFDSWSYFEVADSTMWIVHDEEPVIRRVDAVTRRAVGEPVPRTGAEVGRARFAFDRLWMTDPAGNAVRILAPAT